MDLAALKIVTLVARHGSFAAAARVLDVDPSSVSRTVANVEAGLGLRLFQRSTRILSTTEEGANYIARIVPLLEEFDRAQEDARNVVNGPRGILKMTTSVSFAHVCVVPHLKAFTARYPDIALELLPIDANIDLVANNIDLAIRLAPAPAGDLISTRLMKTRYIVCASPAYVANHPVVKRPEDLQDHACLCFALPDYRTKWRFRQVGMDLIEVPISGHIVISNALSLRHAVLDDLGPALLPDWLIGPDIAAGKLVNLLPQHECAATDFDTGAWALYPSRSYLPNKVRVMIDFLRDRLTGVDASCRLE